MVQECTAINQFGKVAHLFMGKEYAGLSKEALYYIGGILNTLELSMLFPMQQQIVTRD